MSCAFVTQLASMVVLLMPTVHAHVHQISMVPDVNFHNQHQTLLTMLHFVQTSTAGMQQNRSSTVALANACGVKTNNAITWAN
jgi:hypothetical protein